MISPRNEIKATQVAIHFPCLFTDDCGRCRCEFDANTLKPRPPPSGRFHSDDSKEGRSF